MEERKISAQDLKKFAEETVPNQKLKTLVTKLLGGRSDFASAWKKTSQENKVIVYNLWQETQNKEQFEKGVQELLDQKKAGIPDIENTQLDERSEGQNVNADEVQDAIQKLSDDGKKKMNEVLQEEIIDTKTLRDTISTLSKRDQQKLSEELDVDIEDITAYLGNIYAGAIGYKFGQSHQNVFDTRSAPSDYYRNISYKTQKSHPKATKKIEQMQMYFPVSFAGSQASQSDDIPYVDLQTILRNKRQEKIYNRIKDSEKQQMLTASEHNKLLYKELTRNTDQHGADLAVVENKHGIEEYRVRYPNIDQMLNSTLIQQYAFDLAQKRHLTFVQSNLLKDILKSGGEIVVPNIEFLKEAYMNKQSRGQEYQQEFKAYQDALINQIGKQVAYNGEQQWKTDISRPTKNLSAPALQQQFQKPKMIDVKDVLVGIDQMVDYISKLSGNLNELQLNKYKQVDDVFSSNTVIKKEPTSFKPQPGMSFKIRELMC